MHSELNQIIILVRIVSYVDSQFNVKILKSVRVAIVRNDVASHKALEGPSKTNYKFGLDRHSTRVQARSLAVQYKGFATPDHNAARYTKSGVAITIFYVYLHGLIMFRPY